jgi:hypothetical protein
LKDKAWLSKTKHEAMQNIYSFSANRTDPSHRIGYSCSKKDRRT